MPLPFRRDPHPCQPDPILTRDKAGDDRRGHVVVDGDQAGHPDDLLIDLRHPERCEMARDIIEIGIP